MIQVTGVSKTYGDGVNAITALDDVSLTIERGEFITIVGPSGSGKSTLLQLIGGLDTPSTGEIVVDGCPLSRLSDDALTLLRRRKIGLVFQFFNLLPTLTAEENVALPLLLDGLRAPVIRARVDHVLEVVGLATRRHHRPDALSGGEMQRIAIARALVTEPALLLADEPTGNLDSATGEQILALISDANRKGQTTLLVTHDPRVAAYGRRTITIKDGRIANERRRPVVASLAGGGDA